MPENNPTPASVDPRRTRRLMLLLGATVVILALATLAVLLLLENIATRKKEAQEVVFRLVTLTERTEDPAEWGKNFPRQYDAYLRTSERTGTKYGGGGSDTLAHDRLAEDPRLKVLFDGYPFAVDFRARRGHAYMLVDQRDTQRVKQFKQSGACLHCHASNVLAYREAGIADGAPGTMDAPLLSPEGLAQLQRGFVKIGAMPYAEANKLVSHPVACIDCHDPKSMQLRITRPGFLNGIQALANSDDPLPHLPSIERWRKGDRKQPYDPNTMASRQEMRSFVCGQCHVEYYCGPKVTLFFPWNNGLKVEKIEAYYNSYKFPDGHRFFDWKHKTAGSELLKAQHPEFEMWSQGVHARSGVACADCHMPYQREGAVKISDHWIRSPLLNVNRACQVCHYYPESELLARVDAIQSRTHALMGRAEDATVELIRALESAQASSGVPAEKLEAARELHRKAQWRVDFVNAENSMGFHAPQEAARILGEAIDYARQGQILLSKP